MNEVTQERLVRLPEVLRLTGLSRTAVYKKPDFPRPIKLGPRASAWRLSAVEAWIRARIEAGAAERAA